MISQILNKIDEEYQHVGYREHVEKGYKAKGKLLD